MAELVLDGDCRTYDINMFRHDRFHTGDLHRSAYTYGILG
jgi:hypothetical protein